MYGQIFGALYIYRREGWYFFDLSINDPLPLRKEKDSILKCILIE